MHPANSKVLVSHATAFRCNAHATLVACCLPMRVAATLTCIQMLLFIQKANLEKNGTAPAHMAAPQKICSHWMHESNKSLRERKAVMHDLPHCNPKGNLMSRNKAANAWQVGFSAGWCGPACVYTQLKHHHLSSRSAMHNRACSKRASMCLTTHGEVWVGNAQELAAPSMWRQNYVQTHSCVSLALTCTRQVARTATDLHEIGHKRIGAHSAPR